MKTRVTIAMTLLAGLVAVSALAQGAGDAAEGKKLFGDTGDYEYPSCAHCHATVSATDEFKATGHVRPAFPVFNAAHRGAYKNKPKGKAPATAADAGNICVKVFQKRKPLPAAQLAHLNAYIASVSPGKDAKPRKILYAPKLPADLDSGDAAKGKDKVVMYCGGCHGASDDHLQIELKAGKFKKNKVVMKVRGWIRDKKAKSGMRFKPNAGQMSFFATNRLPDEDLLDILAYLGRK